jgi:outer membrane protein TolC
MKSRFFIILFLVQNLLFSQSDSLTIGNNDSTNILLFNFMSKLPSYQQLLDSAKLNSPLLKSKDALIETKEYELASQRLDWTKSIMLRSATAYGTGGIDLSQSNLSSNLVSSNTSWRTDAVFMISVSPSLILQRKKDIKAKQAQIKYEKEIKSEIERNMERELITAYNNLITSYEVFKINNKIVESNTNTLIIAEKEFANGQLSLIEFNDIYWKNAKSLIEYEGSKNQFITSFQLLELISGVSLNNF